MAISGGERPAGSSSLGESYRREAAPQAKSACACQRLREEVMSTSVEAETGGVKILWLLVHACSYQHNRAHQLLVSGNTRQTARGDGKPSAILRVAAICGDREGGKLHRRDRA